MTDLRDKCPVCKFELHCAGCSTLTRERDEARAEAKEVNGERLRLCVDLAREQMRVSDLEAEVARLKETLAESYRVDGRLTPDYERGWNDAVGFLHVVVTPVTPAAEPPTPSKCFACGGDANGCPPTGMPCLHPPEEKKP